LYVTSTTTQWPEETASTGPDHRGGTIRHVATRIFQSISPVILCALQCMGVGASQEFRRAAAHAPLRTGGCRRHLSCREKDASCTALRACHSHTAAVQRPPAGRAGSVQVQVTAAKQRTPVTCACNTSPTRLRCASAVLLPTDSTQSQRGSDRFLQRNDRSSKPDGSTDRDDSVRGMNSSGFKKRQKKCRLPFHRLGTLTSCSCITVSRFESTTTACASFIYYMMK